MAYALQGDIEARYPGELAQAGPREPDGDLDTAAIALALERASLLADGHLAISPFGYVVPVDPAPVWLQELVVDLALYLATPTVLAGQADFADRRQRYADALSRLAAIAAGRFLPGTSAEQGTLTAGDALVVAEDRLFGRGVL